MKKLLLYLLLFTSFNLNAQTNNYSLSFDGAGNYAEFSNPSNSSSYTYSCWIKPSSVNGGYIVSRGHNTHWIEILSNGALLSGTSSSSFGTTYFHNTVLSANNWYHIAISYDGSNFKQYIDGIETFSISGSAITPSNNLMLGKDPDYPAVFSGLIDQVCLWDNALSSIDIQNYMNCPPTGNEAGLVGYWNFEEGSGTATADQTANGNNGTIYGASWSSDVPASNCCTPNPITSQPTNQSISIGNDATFSFIDNLTGATYQWQINAGTGYSALSNAGQFSGTDTQTLTISSTSMSNNNTLYRCVVTESAGCSDTTDVSTLTVIDNTSITELNNSLVKLFPNPSNGNITLDIAQHANGQIILTDILGKEVLSKSFTSNEAQLNLKSLESKGTYFAKVIDLDGNVIAIKKLIYQ